MSILNLSLNHHNSAVSRSQAQDEKRGGWWQPHYVVFYESEEELYYGYIDLRVFVLVLSYEGAAGLTIIHCLNFINLSIKMRINLRSRENGIIKL
ncbi:hypothetical protein BpHYR1_002950 [Brachionus plicatilis]|uniref:Uncharacterized protein n=1 Tax=Brachionus plicatilis TaxID=10195 RepID=A0A3M7T4G1_BRAPC|nr:hypothetical protein BpHYR1_002950 [Brachionus plicatilis]